MDGNELSRIAAVLQMTVDTVGAARDRLRGAAIEAWPRLAKVFEGDMRD